MNEVELQTIKNVSGWLKKSNLTLVGIDMVKGKIIEINTFSPGGLKDIDTFYSLNFTDLILRELLSL